MLSLLFGLISISNATEFVIVPNYECRLIVAASEPSHSLEKNFMADYASGSHGGREHQFSNGIHEVTLQASNNWMALRWVKNGELVAEGLSAISKASDFDRVMILRNPKNSDEQVSLDCSPEPIK